VVSAWFKDAAQDMTLIEPVARRAELQAKALGEMRVKFEKYCLHVMEVMIGTPRAMPGDTHIDTVFEQLRARQVARAIAQQQTALIASKVAIQVAQNEGEAQPARPRRTARAVWVRQRRRRRRRGGETRGAGMVDMLMAVSLADGATGRALVK
jgi:hypothetical protein